MSGAGSFARFDDGAGTGSSAAPSGGAGAAPVAAAAAPAGHDIVAGSDKGSVKAPPKKGGDGKAGIFMASFNLSNAVRIQKCRTGSNVAVSARNIHCVAESAR